MPRSDRAPSRRWRRSGTLSCSASSNCAPSVRRWSPRTQSQLSNGAAAASNTPLTEKELAMNISTTLRTEKSQPDLLTETIVSKLGNPETSSDIDLHAATNQVLEEVGMSNADSGGKVTSYARDPIIRAPHRFGAMAAIGLAAKAVSVA